MTIEQVETLSPGNFGLGADETAFNFDQSVDQLAQAGGDMTGYDSWTNAPDRNRSGQGLAGLFRRILTDFDLPGGVSDAQARSILTRLQSQLNSMSQSYGLDPRYASGLVTQVLGAETFQLTISRGHNDAYVRQVIKNVLHTATDGALNSSNADGPSMGIVNMKPGNLSLNVISNIQDAGLRQTLISAWRNDGKVSANELGNVIGSDIYKNIHVVMAYAKTAQPIAQAVMNRTDIIAQPRTVSGANDAGARVHETLYAKGPTATAFAVLQADLNQLAGTSIKPDGYSGDQSSRAIMHAASQIRSGAIPVGQAQALLNKHQGLMQVLEASLGRPSGETQAYRGALQAIEAAIRAR